MKEYFGELSVIGMKGCDNFVRRVDEYLCQWRKNEKKTYIVDVDCPRFGTGEAKGIINASLDGRAIKAAFCIYTRRICFLCAI